MERGLRGAAEIPGCPAPPGLRFEAQHDAQVISSGTYLSGKICI